MHTKKIVKLKKIAINTKSPTTNTMNKEHAEQNKMNKTATIEKQSH